MKQFVAFKLVNEIYGVPIVQVQEIIQKPQMTRLPQMPDFVEGVVNLRGKIVPVIDLRKRFNMDFSSDIAKTRIIVTQIADQFVGFTVDSVVGVSNLNEDAIEPVPESIGKKGGREFLSGIGKMENDMMILLDLEKVLSAMERTSLSSAEQNAQ